MNVTVEQRFVHMAPRKLRLVADVVRGKSADEATATLTVMPRVAAKPVLMAIKAAVNAAKQKQQDGPFVVSAIFVNEGPAMKRRILKSRGRASRMEHRMSHISVTVAAGTVSAKKSRTEKKG